MKKITMFFFGLCFLFCSTAKAKEFVTEDKYELQQKLALCELSGGKFHLEKISADVAGPENSWKYSCQLPEASIKAPTTKKTWEINIPCPFFSFVAYGFFKLYDLMVPPQ